jgi:hypothetical protein
MKPVKGWQCVLALVMVLGCGPLAYAAPFTFSLLPASGEITGEPGSTIGWGYSITNPSETDWLMLTALNHDPFLNAATESLTLLPILQPRETQTVSYNPSSLDGLFQITWDALAPVGFLNVGQFILSAEFWQGDPFGEGAFLSLADDQAASYSARVSAAPAPVPEPATLLLMATGLGATGLLERRRRRSRTAALGR